MPLTDDLQQIQALAQGIERMVQAAIATGTTSPNLYRNEWEEIARNIRDQLKGLSDEVAQLMRSAPPRP